MKIRAFGTVTACLLVLAGLVGLAGCGKKPETTTPPGTNAPPPEQATNAAPVATNQVTSPTADSASPLYGWEKFFSPDGSFYAFFPKEPKEDDKTEQGSVQEVQMHLFVAGADSRNAYGAGYYDLSKGGDAKMVLARIEESMVKKHSGKMVSYKASQLNDHPATDFEFTFGDLTDYSSRVRLISAGQRVYVVLAIYQTAQPHSDESDAFFNSFTLAQN